MGSTESTLERPRTRYGSVQIARSFIRQCGDLSDSLSELQLGSTIGCGGVSVVRLAHDDALGRSVAIKFPPPNLPRDEAVSLLLIEASVLAMLEHPNIVPVHATGTTSDGRPALAMKHIEGNEWGDQCDFPITPHTADVHLGVLMTLLSAVQFAHSRGIVHRDIKPDNVMIGPFGEVYLLDWGAAVSLESEHAARVPLAFDVCEPGGTPAYMAPELALGLGEEIDERSDVYLFGATLHELLTGRPPHDADSVELALLRAAHSEPPTFDAAVPTELADICRKAMHREKTQRFDSCEEMRDALAAYLEHKSSYQFSAAATSRVARLAEVIECGEAAEVRRVAVEARFAFREALRDWRHNEEALTGLRELRRMMFDYELTRENIPACEALVAESDEHWPARSAALQRLRKRAATRADDARAHQLLVNNTDFSGLARRFRPALLLVAAFCALAAFGIDFLSESGRITPGYPHLLALCAVPFVVILGVGLARERRNYAERRFFQVVAATAGFGFASVALGSLLGLALWQAQSVMLLAVGTSTFAVAMIGRRVFLVPAFALLCGSAAIALYPAYDAEIVAVSCGLAFGAVALVRGRVSKMLLLFGGGNLDSNAPPSWHPRPNDCARSER